MYLELQETHHGSAAGQADVVNDELNSDLSPITQCQDSDARRR